MTREIVIKYHPDGNVEIEGHGFIGKECLSASKPFEVALGLDNITREMKPDEPKRIEQQRGRNKVST